MKNINKVLIICFLLIFLLACVRHSQIPKNYSLSEQVVEKAVNWLIAHPATFKEGGFLEMGEEINLFYILYTRAESEKEREYYRNRIARIVEEVRAKKDFHIEYDGEITAYLVICRDAEKVGLETDDFHDFIKKEILHNHMTYPPSITYIILNSALLRDLGYEPRVPLEDSISRGIVATMTKDPYLVPVGKNYASSIDVTNFYYDITHEIFALSVFGDKNPEEMLLPGELEFIREIIREGIALYLPKGELDILCELVICAKIINYTDVPHFQQAMDFIIESQHNDGSFGIISRMKDLGRQNLKRHGVLVAAWALAS
ncbi:MAG: DUF6895 family protein [bacterium]